MSKTALEWFSELPEPYKSQAIQNLKEQSDFSEVISNRSGATFDYMSDAITGAMQWSVTPQGHEYWMRLHDDWTERDQPEKNRIKEEEEREAAIIYQERMRQYREQERIRLDNLVTISESMRRMLYEIQDRSVVAKYILQNSDKNLFCNYITMRGCMTSFLPNGKEHIVNDEGNWSRQGRQEMKPAKLARKILPESLELSERHFEEYNNIVKSYIGINGDEEGNGKSVTLEVIDGEHIRDYYNEKNYSEAANMGSNLWGSCMRYDSCRDYFDIYVHNDNIKMLIAKDVNNKIVGRALLWHTNNGRRAMDTIYSDDSVQPMFISWAIDNMYWYKSQQSCHHSQFDMHMGKRQNDWVAEVILSKSRYDYYPYMDTMAYLDTSGKILYNDECQDHDRTLRCTDGSYDENGSIWDDDADENIHEDDSVYLDYSTDSVSFSGHTHIDRTVVTRYGYRILERHSIEVEGHTYPEGHDDVVYLDSLNDYCLVSNVRTCEHDGEEYHIDDMKEFDDDVWVADDNVEEYLEQLKSEENV
jgi:hypothetical protein